MPRKQTSLPRSWRFMTQFLLVSVCASLSVAQDELNAPDKLDSPSKMTKPSGGKELKLSDVRAAIRGLDSDQLTERDKAEKTLIEMGRAVLSFLPAVDANTSGEMKIRLQRIREQLQKEDIETFFDASSVTLVGNMTVDAAIKEIAKQTKNEVTIDNAEGVSQDKIDFNIDKKPFWEALYEVMEKGHLRVNGYSSSNGLALVVDNRESNATKLKGFSRGPFYVEVISVQSTLPFQSALPGQLDLSIQVTWEPRLKPVFIQMAMGKLKATGDNGSEFVAPNALGVQEYPVNESSSTTQIDFQLARPPRSVNKLSKLSGELVMAVPNERHKYVFEKFGSGKRQVEKYGDVTVTLEGARRNGKVFEIRLLTEFKDAQGALESYRGWLLSNQAYLVDAQDNRLDNVGWQSYGVTNQSAGTAYLFQINGDPNDYKVIYESPAAINRQTVSFELENIELP